MFLMKFEIESIVGLKKSNSLGFGSLKISKVFYSPKSYDYPPKKDD